LFFVLQATIVIAIIIKEEKEKPIFPLLCFI
jgi:hypothetical protein